MVRGAVEAASVRVVSRRKQIENGSVFSVRQLRPAPNFHTCAPCAMESAFRGDRLWSGAGRRQGHPGLTPPPPGRPAFSNLRMGCPGVHMQRSNKPATAERGVNHDHIR